MAVWLTLAVGCIFTVGHSEVVKKSLHVRVWWKRPIAVETHHFGTSIDFNSYGYDGRFDLRDQISKPHRALHAFRGVGRRIGWLRLVEHVGANSRAGNAKAGNGRKKDETTR